MIIGAYPARKICGSPIEGKMPQHYASFEFFFSIRESLYARRSRAGFIFNPFVVAQVCTLDFARSRQQINGPPAPNSRVARSPFR
jgi:hypothetical protein